MMQHPEMSRVRQKKEVPAFRFEKDTRERMIRWLEHTHPFFTQVNFTRTEDPAFEGGAFYAPDRNDQPFSVILMGGKVEDYAKLKQTRTDAVKSMARLLGVPFERLDAAVIEAFILLHEAGHAHDYFANFAGEDDAPDYEEVTKMWDANSNMQLETLPIPGFNPSVLRYEIEERGGLAEWRQRDPKFDAACVALKIQTAEELIRKQETAYRALPKEEYADAFAAKTLKDFFATQFPDT